MVCWDALESALADAVLSDGIAARVAVVRVCEDFPTAPVADLTLALASLAATLDEGFVFASLREDPALHEVYRTVTALSADLAAMQVTAVAAHCCQDLLHYWAVMDDPFFATSFQEPYSP